MYPYEEIKADNSEKVLKTCFTLSFELMHLLEPLGQCSSDYCDTGDPERIALGIRAFTSSMDGLHMLRDIGDGILKTLISLGCLGEFIKKYGAKNEHDEETVKLWEQIGSDLKKADGGRTYDVIMKDVEEYMNKFKKNDTKKNICKVCGLPPNLCVCEELKKQSNVHNKKILSELKKKAIEKAIEKSQNRK